MDLAVKTEKIIEEDKWTAKEDLELIFDTFKPREGPPLPKVNGNKIERLQAKIREANSLHNQKTKVERPVFDKIRLNDDEWVQAMDYYEIDLQNILDSDDVIPRLVDLEVWFLKLIPSLPRVRNEETLAVWRERYRSIGKRYYSDLLPPEYRKKVSVLTKEALPKGWQEKYLKEINDLSRVVVFKQFPKVKLPPKTKGERKLVQLNRK